MRNPTTDMRSLCEDLSLETPASPHYFCKQIIPFKPQFLCLRGRSYDYSVNVFVALPILKSAQKLKFLAHCLFWSVQPQIAPNR